MWTLAPWKAAASHSCVEESCLQRETWFGGNSAAATFLPVQAEYSTLRVEGQTTSLYDVCASGGGADA